MNPLGLSKLSPWPGSLNWWKVFKFSTVYCLLPPSFNNSPIVLSLWSDLNITHNFPYFCPITCLHQQHEKISSFIYFFSMEMNLSTLSHVLINFTVKHKIIKQIVFSNLVFLWKINATLLYQLITKPVKYRSAINISKRIPEPNCNEECWW